MFEGTEIKITDGGKRALGAAIGSAEFVAEFLREKVLKWSEQVECSLARSHISEIFPLGPGVPTPPSMQLPRPRDPNSSLHCRDPGTPRNIVVPVARDPGTPNTSCWPSCCDPGTPNTSC